MKTLEAITILLAIYGAFDICIRFGRMSYRWSQAIDELIKQHKERKK